jgi:methylase of polypeptide subunit release factors
MEIADQAALFQLLSVLKSANYRFTTVTPATHQRVNARPGNQWATDLPGIFGWNRPFRAQAAPTSIFHLMDQAGVLAPCGEGWRSLVRVSSLGDELFLHSAFPTQESDAVFFGPDTYRYAASIQNHLASRQAVRRVVDIGCGSGAGAIVARLACPQAEVIALDINERALEFTRLNARLADVDIEVKHSDLLGAVQGEFDLILANPPYMADPAGRAYRDGGGFLGSGLSQAIVAGGCKALSLGGTLLLYTGVAIVGGKDAFFATVQPYLDGAKMAWSYREIDPDVFGEELLQAPYDQADRIAVVELSATRQV